MASVSIPICAKLSSSPHFKPTNSSPFPRYKPQIVTPRRTLRQAVSTTQSPIIDVPNADLISSLKLKLLAAVSGLNRGLAATADDLQIADSAAKDLESAAGPIDLSIDLDKLQGRWKLIYSSAFSSRTPGGSPLRPPTERLIPLTIGRVFQRIDVLSKDFDNIVEIEIGAPWPLQPIELIESLSHKFEVIGSSVIRIKLEKTTLKTVNGNLSQLPPLELPRFPEWLRQSSSSNGSDEFEVTYMDSDTRITRGDRGELKVFVNWLKL